MWKDLRIHGFLLGMYCRHLDQVLLGCLQVSSQTTEQILLRRENGEIIKTIVLVKPEGRRQKSRSGMRNEIDGWMDGVEKDLRNLGVFNWKTKVQAGDGWRKFVEQANTHKGL